MPSLLTTYQSAPKQKEGGEETKGDILAQIISALKMPYPTVRRKILEESFSYPEKLVICQTRKQDMDDLFPEHKFQNS